MPRKQFLFHNKLNQPNNPGSDMLYMSLAGSKSLQNTSVNSKDELVEKMLVCIENLPPRYKEIIDLYFFQSKTIKEIIPIIGMSESTVRNRLGYSLHLLKKNIAK
ncbi:MAG TPA: sigma-70 family RNA polymerase sigma factor [Parafilimonas sp.]|nr:sigma-70 family RNA polymerase sigma factor [Parafilimonas sp.]